MTKPSGQFPEDCRTHIGGGFEGSLHRFGEFV